MNMLLAGVFLKRGLRPGGGHFVILSRLTGHEAAAAMALFGKEINGDKAVELATRAATDPQLAWVAVGNLRKGRQMEPWLGTSPCSPSAALMWSMRRT